jgi:hypothetical protein
MLHLVCDLDIVFLRPGPAGRIISDGGDIDNRIKVLFDALRKPTNESEMPLKAGEDSPNPIYCLLEDDKLVTSVKITTGQLLVPETTDSAEACVSIHATVRGIGPYTPYEFK